MMSAPVVHSVQPAAAPAPGATVQPLNLLAALAVQHLTPLPMRAGDRPHEQQVRRMRRLARTIAVSRRVTGVNEAWQAFWHGLSRRDMAAHLRRVSRWADETWATQPGLTPDQCQQYRSLGYSARYVADRIEQHPAGQCSA